MGSVSQIAAARAVLHLGESLEIMRSLPSGSVDAIVTDPPYSSGGYVRGDRMQSTRKKYVSTDAKHQIPAFSGDNRDQRGYLAWSALWMSEARRIAKPGALICVFSDWRQLPTTTDAIQAAGWLWRGVAVWGKANARPYPGRYCAQAEFIVWGTNGPRPPAGKCARGLWIADVPRGKERVHITQKPVEVMSGIVSAIEPGGTVLDPFAGSGTTAIACAEAGLNFIGIEQDPDIHAAALKRLAA